MQKIYCNSGFLQEDKISCGDKHLSLDSWLEESKKNVLEYTSDDIGFCMHNFFAAFKKKNAS